MGTCKDYLPFCSDVIGFPIEYHGIMGEDLCALHVLTCGNGMGS